MQMAARPCSIARFHQVFRIIAHELFHAPAPLNRNLPRRLQQILFDDKRQILPCLLHKL